MKFKIWLKENYLPGDEYPSSFEEPEENIPKQIKPISLPILHMGDITAYNRTSIFDSLRKNGYQVNNNENMTFGRGTYFTTDLKAILSRSMLQFGNYVVKAQIKTDFMAIFDNNMAKQRLNKTCNIRQQLTMMAKKRNMYDQSFEKLLDELESKGRGIIQPGSVRELPNGLIDSLASMDGDRLDIVVKNPKVITPIGYAYTPTETTKVKWNSWG